MTETTRIVVVDDNCDQLLLAKLILEGGGFEVLTLKDSEFGVQRIIAFRPHLIFMDHSMSFITGVEATRLLKSTEGCKHIPVVYHSSQDDIREQAELAGADHWLMKSIDRGDLVNAVRKFLARGSCSI